MPFCRSNMAGRAYAAATSSRSSMSPTGSRSEAALSARSCPTCGPEPERLFAVECVQPLAVHLRDHVTPDFHRRCELLIVDGERLIGKDEAADLLDHRKIGVHPIDRALQPLLQIGC